MTSMCMAFSLRLARRAAWPLGNCPSSRTQQQPIQFYSLGAALGDAFSQQVRTATKKAGGTIKNGRDSPGQRLGLKKFGGEAVKVGHIILRQRGQRYHCGANTKMGRDHTIYSVSEGYVKFVWDKLKKRQFVTVQAEDPNPPSNNPNNPAYKGRLQAGEAKSGEEQKA